jgi:hypothetical protein
MLVVTVLQKEKQDQELTQKIQVVAAEVINNQQVQHQVQQVDKVLH